MAPRTFILTLLAASVTALGASAQDAEGDAGEETPPVTEGDDAADDAAAPTEANEVAAEVTDEAAEAAEATEATEEAAEATEEAAEATEEAAEAAEATEATEEAAEATEEAAEATEATEEAVEATAETEKVAPEAAAAPAKKASQLKDKLRWSDFVKTTLVFYVGDDNLLAGNADRSPNFGMGREYPELFFEGLNSEKLAVVQETHMVLYAKAPGFLPFVDTEAAFVAEFELYRDPDDARLAGRFRDDGSWVGATFWFNRAKRGPNLKLTAWPFSADRFRLGYTYDVTWAGDYLWVKNRSPVPGVKLTFNSDRFYGFVGAKSLIRQRADNYESESYWGVLGGAGPNFKFGPGGLAHLSYDIGGGYFTRGTFQQDPWRSKPVVAYGMSQRVMFTYNHKMGVSTDLRLMDNDPDHKRDWRGVPQWKGEFGFGVSGELTTLWQSLIGPTNSSHDLVMDDAIAAVVTAQARFLKNMRVGVDLVYRDVSFLVFNVPGLIPYVSFAEDTIQKPQVYGALWWDWYIERAKLTPGVIFGLMQPASFQAEAQADGNRALQVIRGANDYEIMPNGEGPFTIISGKARLTWHLSNILNITGEVAYTHDYNQSKVVTDPDTGVGSRILDEKRARALGLNLMVSARF